MSPVAVINFDRSLAEPSSEVLDSFRQVRRVLLAGNNGDSAVARAAIIASGLPTSVSGVDLPQVLVPEPLHVRPRRASDCAFPWVWDLVVDAGMQAGIVGWPGLSSVEGSSARMVSIDALKQQGRGSDHWPLAAPFVTPSNCRDAVAAARIATDDLDVSPYRAMLDVLPTKQMVHRARGAIATCLSGLGAMEVLGADGLDLAMFNLQLPPLSPALKPLVTCLIDLSARRILDVTGPDTTLLVVSSFRGSNRLLLATRDTDDDGETTRQGTLLDITPTILGCLGITPPEDLAGSDQGVVGAGVTPRFDIAPDSDDQGMDLDHLIERLLVGDADGMTARRRDALLRFTLTTLHAKRIKAYRALDFGLVRKWTERLLRFTPSARNMWELAFACNRLGDHEGAAAASRELLDKHPGSSEAVLSAALLDQGRNNTSELKVIVESVDPTGLRSPSISGVWGRLAIRVGNMEEGMAALITLVERGVALPIDRFALVRACMQLGEHEKAAKYIGGLGSGRRGLLKWRILRARVLLKVGRKDEALQIAESILVSHPMEKNAVEIRDLVNRSKID
ncbi:MAG: tetratricopeptide repeat protein [Phycisphaerales bacterium]|nr:tetratricopeptide repeat protein [Phycisphaerales bacterium]